MNSGGSPLGSGSQIGGYRIEAPLGKGGMGTVYRALDSKLSRPVAIKFLSNEWADAAARRRFQREAQMASSLNHPHILTVHDVGEFEGRQYLVTEFVDGVTLKDWCAEKRTWRQIVGLLTGVADGLATAHAASILHRDVKPANILVARNGYAKLADFGLAKLAADAPPSDETADHTQAGVVVGTAAYMSPEQASGSPLDARSDIFSFGVVLYEMLAGTRPFSGATSLETLRAIVERTPEPLGNDVPLALRMIVEKALEKDPAERYQSMREMVVDLRRLVRKPAEETPSETVSPRRRNWLWAGVAILALGIGVVGGRWWLAGTAVPPEDISIQRLTDFKGMEEHPAVSPDGKTLAFVFPVNGRRQVWVRPLASDENTAPLQITNDDADHEHPRWSPDSSSLIYFSGSSRENDPGTLSIVSSYGTTPPRPVIPAQGEGDISRDGRIAVFQTQGDSTVLAILARDGSPAEPAKPLDNGFRYRGPRWSPDGRSIAFVRSEGLVYASYLCIMDTRTGMVERLGGGSFGIQGVAWLPDGSGLLYASSAGSTAAYPPVFRLRTVSRDGSQDRQLTFDENSYVDPGIDMTGLIFASRIRMQSDIWRFPVTASPVGLEDGRRITEQTGHVQTPAVSPDGERIVYLSDSGGHVNVWVAGADGAKPRQITNERDPAVVVGVPIWHPSGDRISYIQFRAGVATQWLINADGGGQRRQLGPPGAVAAAFSADSRWFYYMTEREKHCVQKIPVEGGPAVAVQCNAGAPSISLHDSTIYFAPEDSRKGEIRRARPEDAPSEHFAYFEPSRTLLSGGVPQGYALSPDDKWLATQFIDAGTSNIWAWPTAGGPIRQITDFGRRPVLIARRVSWSPDSKFIYAALVETDADIVLLDGAIPSN